MTGLSVTCFPVIIRFEVLAVVSSCKEESGVNGEAGDKAALEYKTPKRTIKPLFLSFLFLPKQSFNQHPMSDFDIASFRERSSTANKTDSVKEESAYAVFLKKRKKSSTTNSV